MDTLQVLVATMHQKDFSIGETMNIRCGAVFANQADRNETAISQTQWGNWKMVTTATRGVGLNRNFGLMSADADILLLDPDMTADTVIARGKKMMEGGTLLRKGTYE